MEGGDPCWSPDPDAARPLTGLHTMAQGAAMVHEGTGSFLFLSGLVDRNLDGALFAAPRPWGPWREVARLPAGFIPGLVAKGATKTGFYFTAAGGGGVTYNLNIGRIELTSIPDASTGVRSRGQRPYRLVPGRSAAWNQRNPSFGASRLP